MVSAVVREGTAAPIELKRIEFRPASRVETGAPPPASARASGAPPSHENKKSEKRAAAGQAAAAAAPSAADARAALALRVDAEVGLPPPSRALHSDAAVARDLVWHGGGSGGHGGALRGARGIGPGLHNLGYTCFLNATLQCLAYLPPFAQLLLDPRFDHAPNGGNGNGNGGGAAARVLRIVRKLVCEMHGVGASGGDGGRHGGHGNGGKGGGKGGGGRKGAIAPSELVNNLKLVGRQFRLGRQEDAHEFLRQLLDTLQTAVLRRAGVSDGSSSGSGGAKPRKPSSEPRLAETSEVRARARTRARRACVFGGAREDAALKSGDRVTRCRVIYMKSLVVGLYVYEVTRRGCTNRLYK